MGAGLRFERRGRGGWILRCQRPADGSDDGLSGGIGIGFEAGSLDVELEYTLIEADINYWSGAIVFRF